MIGVVIFAAVIALMTGLLVWHFHCKCHPQLPLSIHSSERILTQMLDEDKHRLCSIAVTVMNAVTKTANVNGAFWPSVL